MPRKPRAALLEEDNAPLILTADMVSLTPAKTGAATRPISDDHFTDEDYKNLFGENFQFVEDRIFLPDEQLTNDRLLPSSDYIGATAFAEIAETFQLNGDPNFAARRVCTFDDLKIQTTERQLKVFRPLDTQARYLDIILPGWREQFASKSPLQLRGLREFILKPRRFGFSSLILALFFLDTISTPNTQTVIIAHDAESSKKLFDVMRRFYRNLPEEKKPKTGYYSRQEIWFPELDSYIYVGTAGSGQYGRGGTVQNLMGSEAAFWTQPEQIVAGLFNTVPPSGNIFVESTANGLGGWYSDTYFEADRHENEYRATFFPWNIGAQYATPPPPNFTLTDFETRLGKQYNLTNAQLYWRRIKKTQLGPLFEQEYPITDMEAFVTSGTPYFNRVELSELYHKIQTERIVEGDASTPLVFDPLPIAETGLEGAAYPELFRQGLRYHKNGLPLLCVWEPPVPGCMYAIGGDVAEGEEKGKNGTEDDHDYCSASVVRVDTLEEVCQLRGQWEPADYAVLLAQLGFWYNEALLAPERNNHGHSVLNTLQNGRPNYEQWIYPPHKLGGGGLYVMQELEARQTFAARVRDARRNGQQVIQKPGWLTNKKTKPMMLDNLRDLLEQGLIGLNSRVTVGELMKYVHKGVGKSGGEGNSHDDTVIALAIAVYITQFIDRRHYGGADTESMSAGGFTASGGGRGVDGISSLFGAS